MCLIIVGMIRITAAVGLIVLSLSPAAVAQKRAFTLEDVFRGRTVGEVQVSPDGARAAYTVATNDLSRAKRTTQIWLVELASGQTRALTSGTATDHSPRFSPDGKSLAFVSTRDGDANIYLIALDGGESRPVTHISTGVSDPLWSPDGKWIAFSTDVYPECGGDDGLQQDGSPNAGSKGPLKAHMADALLYRHWTDWKDGTRTHIFLANAWPRRVVRDVTPGNVDSPTFQLGGPLQYDFSPDSSELCFVSNHDPAPASPRTTISGCCR